MTSWIAPSGSPRDDDRIELGRANLAIRQGAFARGGALDRRLPAASARGCPGLAGEAGLGDGDRACRRGPSGPGPSAGRRARTRRNSTGWQPGSPPVGGMSHPNGRRSSSLSRPIRPMGPPSTAWPSWRSGKASRPAPPSCASGRRSSISSRLNTRNSCSATNRCATRPRWPAWRNNWVIGSRPRSSRAWRSSPIRAATTFGPRWHG